MNLTKPQKLIYDMEKFAGGAIAVICGSMLIYGKKDLSEIKKAVNELYRLNDALRIRISETEGEVSQTVCDYAEQDIKVLCFDNKAELDAYAEKQAKTPIDLYGNLCEINIVVLPNQYGLLVKLHHMIGDAWTLSLIGTQFNKLVNSEKVETYSYTDYVESEKTYIQSKRYEKDREYFLEQFKKCDEVTYLNEKQDVTPTSCRKTFIIDSTKTKQINDYAKHNGTSAFTLFTAALSTYMNRTKMNAEKFYIGTAVLNRSGIKEKNTMGMFINTVPMLIELDNTESFSENLSGIQKNIYSVFRHQKYNYGDVLSTIRKEFNFTEKLYDVMISYQNATVTGAAIETTWYHSGSQSESLQIHIDDRDSEGIFRIHYDYLTDKFTENEIERMHQHIGNLLFDAIADDSKKLYKLNILSADEKQKLLYEFKNTATDYPRDKCIHQLFEGQVMNAPDKVAIIVCDKTITYAKLNEQANRIAHSLIEKGVGVGDIVAFALPRKSYLIATIFGILKAGAAYLPVDPDYPQDRIDYMLSDSNAKLFITEDNIQELLANDDTSNPSVDMSSNSLCYCIYTSGSTGKPKGTLLKHQGIVNLVTNLDIYANISNCEHIGFMTTITFDVATQEILTALLNGFTGVLMPERKETRADAIIDGIVEHKIDVMYATPTYFDSLTDTKEKANRLLSNIKVVCLAGEGFYLNDIASQYENILFENHYGPAETHVVTADSVTDINDITIGKPIANTQIYIVDQYMQPTPIGVTGELCISGDGVGAGYLNRPELTDEKFIDNPFGEGKLYKTGDLAYWREDGNIVYVGRNDFQVKIRGLRIELGEIENALCGIDGISQAVVVVRKNDEGRQLICAFYTGVEVEAKEIRNHVGKKLPKYMLPHICTHLDEIPLTSSGKINRKALPEIDLENITNDTEYVASETQMQKELCILIELVLGTTPVGITDDFFDLGGDSLKAIEFVSKAHNEGIYFNLQNVFDYPTVKELCKFIENNYKQNISFADIDFSNINNILSNNRIENISTSQKSEVGNVLLAGATGFLGMHILSNFIDNDTGIAYCLVRGLDKKSAKERFYGLLHFYFGEKYDNCNRIAVLCADLHKEKFNLSNSEYDMLLSNVDTVINSAASVKHYGSYEYFHEANVETVNQLIDFCKKADAKLIHSSTLSVSGNSFEEYESEYETRFGEDNLYIGQPLDNVYARSKFEAEKAVLDAMSDGLNANIMRLGFLSNRYNDGVFQKNYESNAFLKRIMAIIKLGNIPKSFEQIPIEFTPIDLAANAIMTITRNFSNAFNVFHICNVKTISMINLIANFQELGIKINSVNDIDFYEMLKEVEKTAESMSVFEAFVNDFKNDNKLDYSSKIKLDSNFTIEYLKQLGFEWPDIGIDYLRKYVEYFKKIGCLKQEETE